MVVMKLREAPLCDVTGEGWVGVFSVFLTCLQYAVFWPPDSLLSLSELFLKPGSVGNVLGLKPFSYCPLTHRCLCACCFSGVGVEVGGGREAEGTEQTCKC